MAFMHMTEPLSDQTCTTQIGPDPLFPYLVEEIGQEQPNEDLK